MGIRANQTVALVGRPTHDADGSHDNLPMCLSWLQQAKHCPCNGCGSAPRCKAKAIACPAYRAWVQNGRAVRNLPRVPDRPVTWND